MCCILVNNQHWATRSFPCTIDFSILLTCAFAMPCSVNSYAILLSSGELFKAISVYIDIIGEVFGPPVAW